jgi:hypothetical protein
MKHEEKPERDPRFNLRRGEVWHRGARVVFDRSNPTGKIHPRRKKR